MSIQDCFIKNQNEKNMFEKTNFGIKNKVRFL